MASQKWTRVSELAPRFLPGAGRLSADKRAFSKERSLSALHGSRDGRGKSSGGSRGRSRGQGAPNSERPTKVPKLDPSGGSLGAPSLEHRKRKRATAEGVSGAGVGGIRRIIAVEDPDVTAKQGERFEAAGRGAVDGTPTPSRARVYWRKGSSSPGGAGGKADAEGVSVEARSVADGATCPPTSTPPQVSFLS